MSESIKNPKVNQEGKDLHTYVSLDIYKKVDQMVAEGLIKTKTEYVEDLISQDIKKREAR